MLDINYYTDYIVKIVTTRFGKVAYSVMVGSIGVMILAVFFSGMMQTATVENLLPIIFGFNGALTGYMALEKTRNDFSRKRLLSMGSGIALVLSATALLNIVFLRWVGFKLVTIDALPVLLLVGIVTSWLGGILAVKYFNLH
ncbi:MAG: hypothetical protein ABFS43_03720 [Thermodesulfobacteriota bacterium]